MKRKNYATIIDEYQKNKNKFIEELEKKDNITIPQAKLQKLNKQ